MRHCEVTSIVPANDNPAPAGQGDLFGSRIRDVSVGRVRLGDRIPILSGHGHGTTAAIAGLADAMPAVCEKGGA